MSQLSSEDDDDLLLKDFRNSSHRFQQRLLEAQHETRDKHLEAELTRAQSQQQSQPSQDVEGDNGLDSMEDEHVAEEIKQLEQQIQATQTDVDNLRTELRVWETRRLREATLTQTNMAERASRVVDQPETSLSPVDLDAIFDYLFEMGQMPASENAAAGFEPNTLLTTTPTIHANAMSHPDVVAQQTFTHLTFTKLENVFDQDDSGCRNCSLEGKAYDSWFAVTVRVDASLTLSSLDFYVDTDLQVDASALLGRIKKECNLMALLRLILHFGRLEDVKKTTFEYLVSRYGDTEITAQREGQAGLLLSSRWSDIQLRLTWNYNDTTLSQQHEALDVTICDYLVPDVRLAVVAEGQSTKLTNVLEKVPGNFQSLSDQVGVIQATEIMVGAILQEPSPQA